MNMQIRLNLSIIFFFCTFFLYSCSEQQDSLLMGESTVVKKSLSLTDKEVMSIAFDGDQTMTQSEAVSYILPFIGSYDKQNSRVASNIHIGKADKDYLITNSNQNLSRSSLKENVDSVPLYEFLIDDQGKNFYALVSADKRSPGVLAFFDNFPKDKNEQLECLNNPNMKAALSLSKLQLLRDVEKVECVKSELREKTINKICNELCISREGYSYGKVKNYIDSREQSSRNSEGVVMPQEQIVLKKGPLSNLLWEQGIPYNGACPKANILFKVTDDWGFVQEGRVPAGCVTIACMNVEACVGRSSIGGIPMDWDYYKKNRVLKEAQEGQTEGTPKLLLDRAQKAISYVYDQLYSQSRYAEYEGKSYVSATESKFGTSYVKNNFNCGEEQTFDPDVVLSSLNDYKPVYVEGYVYGTTTDDHSQYVYEGHAFVIDGYILTQKSSLYSIDELQSRAYLVKYYDMYWHLSLGWGETAGYFKLDSDATCTPDFYDKYGRYNLINLQNMTIVPNISKK